MGFGARFEQLSRYWRVMVAGGRSEEILLAEREVIHDVLLEPLRAVGIVVIRVVADHDVRPSDRVFQVAHLWEARHRMARVGIRAGHGSPRAQDV